MHPQCPIRGQHNSSKTPYVSNNKTKRPRPSDIHNPIVGTRARELINLNLIHINCVRLDAWLQPWLWARSVVVVGTPFLQCDARDGAHGIF